MQNYGDIITRLKELIDSSEERKKELTSEELNNYNYYFVKILKYDICLEYTKEFRELLETERTFYAYHNSEAPLKNNEDLALLCIEKAQEKSETSADFIALNEIITLSNNQSITVLIEHKGYYILKDKLEEFISLCQKLKIGPFRLVSDISQEELNNYANLLSQSLNEQQTRIEKYLNPKETQKNEEDQNQIINGNNISYILMGLHGKLTIEVVADLKSVLGIDEFEKLLQGLEIWLIFTKEEISEIRNLAAERSNIVTIDDLVNYFSKQEGLDVKALVNIVPAIGIENYKYLVFQLYKLGVINANSYELSKSVVKQLESNQGGRKGARN